MLVERSKLGLPVKIKPPPLWEVIILYVQVWIRIWNLFYFNSCYIWWLIFSFIMR
jgi:hypothetical protein